MMKKLLLCVVLMTAGFWALAQGNWIEVNSNLNAGRGIGQISVGMNDQNAFWAHAIDASGQIVDEYTRSTDGGFTWTQGSFNAGDGLSMLFAIDANTCWAVFNTGASQGLYKTINGGSTWVKKGTAYGANSFANVIHFFNNNDGFAQGDPESGYYELYTTTNGGETWTRVPSANIPAPLSSGEYGITGNYDAFGDIIWWGTNMGRIYKSTDKGYTWEVYETTFGTSTVVDCKFKDALHGIAYRSYLDLGIEPVLNITSDGGETWTGVTVTGNMYGRYFNYIPGTENTYISSSFNSAESGISYSIDGGYTWITLDEGIAFQAMAWFSNETGFVGTWADAMRSTGGMLIYDGEPLVGGFPIMEVDPLSFEPSVVSGETATDILTISNSGTLDLNYSISIVYDLDGSFQLPVVEGSGQPVSLSYDVAESRPYNPEGLAPNSRDEVELHYDGDPYYGILFYGWPITVQIGAMFPSAVTVPYAGMELTSIRVYIQTSLGILQTKVRVYGMGSANTPGTLLHNQNFTAEDGWNTIELTNPIPINGEDIWLAYYFMEFDSVYSASTDQGIDPDPNGRWQQIGTGPWQRSTLLYNYNIRGTLTGEPIEQWLSLDKLSGTLAPGGSDEINLTFDASMLPEGSYNATLIIQSNDLDNPMLEIPVSLTVEASPLVPPSNLTAEVDCQDVVLMWEAPVTESGERVELLGYNIYRDEMLVNPDPVQETTYIDAMMDPGTYSYTVKAVYDEGESIPVGPVMATVRSLDPVEDLVIENEPGTPDVYLTWSAPAFWIHWDDGENDDAIGLVNGGTFDVAALFDTDFLLDYEGMYLTKIRFFPRSNVTEYALKVWWGSTLVVDQPVFPNINEWNLIDLDTPVMIDAAEDLLIGYTCIDQPAGQFPAGNDNGPAIAGYGDLIRFSGNDWQSMYSIDPTQFNFNWNIQGYLEWTTAPANPLVPLEDKIAINPEGSIPVRGFLPPAENPVFSAPMHALLGYNVWRNGEMLTETPITETSYADMGVENGSYEYCVTSNYGEDCDSEPVCGEEEIIISVGMPETNDGIITIYPNPSHGFVNIETTVQIKSIRMMNYSGQIVYSNSHLQPGKLTTISTAAFETGIYFIVVETNDGTFAKKITVQ